MTTEDNKKKTALWLTGLVVGMVGLSFASVPLYDLFCRVTGFGGTTQVSESLPDTVLDREITIRLVSEVHPDLPWDFRPNKREVTMKVGEGRTVTYVAQNLSSQTTTGTSIYNVTPPKVGQYFHKIQCFCFDAQTLATGESTDFPLLFYVDPAIADDPNLDDVKVITLGYTFFRSDTPAFVSAADAYNARNTDETL